MIWSQFGYKACSPLVHLHILPTQLLFFVEKTVFEKNAISRRTWMLYLVTIQKYGKNSWQVTTYTDFYSNSHSTSINEIPQNSTEYRWKKLTHFPEFPSRVNTKPVLRQSQAVCRKLWGVASSLAPVIIIITEFHVGPLRNTGKIVSKSRVRLSRTVRQYFWKTNDRNLCKLPPPSPTFLPHYHMAAPISEATDRHSPAGTSQAKGNE